jgi:hypothetical protein
VAVAFRVAAAHLAAVALREDGDGAD